MSVAMPQAGFPRPFGAYLLLQSLGRGGMGEVFLGLRGKLAGAERLCVVKTVRADLRTEAEYARRFIDEARVVVTLHHAAISSVFDVGRVDDALYLAMEHIPGFTLRQVLDALALVQRTLPVGLAVHVIGELLDALDYAHRHRHPTTDEPLHIVHRDVSPQNLMLSFEGNVSLIDFGLAESAIKVEETSKDVVQGKAMYMSPEQARGDPVDGRTDQYAAAIVMYEMLVGQRYYAGMGQMQVLAATQNSAYRPPAWDQVDAGFQQVLTRALSWDAQARFPSCADFASAVRAHIGTTVPAMGRSDLRALLRSTLGAEISAAQAGVALLRQAAARSSSSPTLELAPVPVEPAEASLPTPSVANWSSPPAPDDGTTATHLVLRELRLVRRRGAAATVALAACAVAVAVAVAVVALGTAHDDDALANQPDDAVAAPTPHAAVPLVSEPSTGDATTPAAAVAPRPAAAEHAGVLAQPGPPEPAVEPLPPAKRRKVAVPPARPAAAPPLPVVPAEAVSPSPPPPPPPSAARTASVDEMVRAVTTWCQLPCTRGLRALAAKGAKLEAASVAPCYQSCVGR